MNKQGRYFPGKGRYESDSDGDSDSDSDKEDRRNEERVSNDKKISSVGSNLKKDGRQSGSTNTKISQLVFNDGQIVQSKTPIQRTISKEEEEEEEQEEEEEDEEEEEEEEEESGSESSSSSSEEEYTKPVFISRNKRKTTTETKVVEHQKQDNSSNESDKSHATAFREIERSVNRMARDDWLTRQENSIDVVENVEGLDDTDDLDPALEYSLWRQRELARLKRDRDALIQLEREREEREERAAKSGKSISSTGN